MNWLFVNLSTLRNALVPSLQRMKFFCHTTFYVTNYYHKSQLINIRRTKRAIPASEILDGGAVS